MPQLISIQQSDRKQYEADNWRAVVRFNNGPEYAVCVSNPFSVEEEQELEWYFEEHSKSPFTGKVRASNAATSIKIYGEKLFKQIFGDGDIYSEYRKMLEAGPSDVAIEIEGSPIFHALHWEALKDPQFEQPLALQATIVRKYTKTQKQQLPIRPSPTVNLLIVTARPAGKGDAGYRTISGPLVESLRNANLRVRVDILRPGTYKTLEQHLCETTKQNGKGYYQVIHFDVHGNVFNNHKAYLSFEGEQNGEVRFVKAAEIAELLYTHEIPIVILNACQSGKQIGARETSLGIRLIQEGIQLVLAMGYSVTVSAAELLMRTLYQKLFAGVDLSVAIRHARTELYNNKARKAYSDQRIDLEDWLLPVVYQNQPVQFKPREFTPEERSAYHRRKLAEKQYAPPEPQYGFVGRDLDILQIEKRLLSKHNLLLLRGMGGAGKTTLLRHLRTWWHTTGFVQQTFYFGYDQQAWTLQQILTTIAQQLYGTNYYADIQPYPLDKQQLILVKKLRGEPHLLILDNLESITGTHLAIGHILPKPERDALRYFLSDLSRGKTLVLLGSRGSEDWLSRGTLEDNRYDLSGLDPEAASTLAYRILEHNNARQYCDDEHLSHLIKLLDGFPLALEVVLANLKHQTPKQLLEALQEGDVMLDTDKSQQQGKDIFEQKTESILRCVDYSHSNLSPDAQQLLLCLAPFTSVIWQDWLDQYTERLKKQPILSKLSFERWPEVIREAQNWGLLSPHEEPGFLRLQPALTYFLRNRLRELGQAEIKRAIETAFREHYHQLGNTLFQLLESKEPENKQEGQLLTGLEYENLVTALNLALEARVSILEPHRALSYYLTATQDHRRGLELGQMVLRKLEGYSSKTLSGGVSADFVGVLDDIANRQLRLNLYKEAEVSLQKALAIHLELKIFDQATSKKLGAAIYHNLGMAAKEQRQWQRAEHYFQQALQVFVESNDRHSQASIFNGLGIVALEQRKFGQAKHYFQQALQVFVESNDRHSQANIRHNLGRVAQEQWHFEQARHNFQQASQIRTKFSDRYNLEYSDRYNQARTFHEFGMVAQEQHQWQQAEKYFQQALQIYNEYNDRHSQASTYHDLGIVAQEQQQFEQAEQYYQQALQIRIESKDRYGQAGTYHQLGVLAEKQQRWRQARDYLLQALEIFGEYKDQYNIDITKHNLARLWKASGDADVPAGLARVAGVTVEEAKQMLRKGSETAKAAVFARMTGMSEEEARMELRKLLGEKLGGM